MPSSTVPTAPTPASLWTVSQVVSLVGVAALMVGGLGLGGRRPGHIALAGRAAVVLGAAAAAATLVHDVAVAVPLLRGEGAPAPGPLAQRVLPLLDTLDFALVVGLAVVVLAWAGRGGSRLLPASAALIGLAVPATGGVQTLAAGGLAVGLTLFAVLDRRRPARLVELAAVGLAVTALVAAAWVSVPRAVLAVVAVPLLVRAARRPDLGPH